MSKVITNKSGAIAQIVLSNPDKMNAMTMQMWQAIPGALQEFDQDPEVRVIVISGDGEKAFISGADISQFDKLRSTEDAQAEYNACVSAAYAAPILCSKPVLQASGGTALGGDLGLLLLVMFASAQRTRSLECQPLD